MAEQDKAQQDVTTHNLVYLWKIPIDKTYVKSIIGILKVAGAVLSLIAFICVASGRSDNCDDDYSSTYNYFEFVSLSAFFTLLIFWMAHAITLSSRLFFKMVPWVFVDLVYCVIYIIFYVIADIVLAAQDCGKGSNKAGAAFGFFALGCFCGNAFLAFKEWRSQSQRPSGGTGSGDATANNERTMNERNLELY